MTCFSPLNGVVFNMCIYNACAIAYTIVSLNNYCNNSLLRLGNTIQNNDISILDARYLESIPIFKIEQQHRYHSHAYLYDVQAEDTQLSLVLHVCIPMRMHAHLLSTQLVRDTFDTGFKSTQNRIEIKILVLSQPYSLFMFTISHF